MSGQTPAPNDWCVMTTADLAELQRLRREKVELLEALEPFACLFLYPDDLEFEHAEDIRSEADWDEDANNLQTDNVFVLRRDIRKARAAIAKAEGRS